MKEKIINILKFLGFLGAGIFLFWLVYKDQDMEQIKDALRHTDYLWIWLSLIFGLLSHISRSLRWRMLLKQMGYNPSVINSFLAVMVNYVANLAIPRLGEVSRCGVVKQYEKIPFTKSFGTVIAERAIDLIMLFILLIFVMITQSHVVLQFLNNNPEISGRFSGLLEHKYLLSAIVLVGIIAFISVLVFWKKLLKYGIFSKINEFVINLLHGIKAVWHLERKWIFILHTLFIWSMYYVMIYICFQSFEFTKNLPPLTGLTVFVLASFGMVAPVQGGMGAWHFMVTRTLFIFGVTIEPDGNAFALVVHGAQTLMLAVVGIIALILLPIVNRNYKPIITNEAEMVQ